MSGLSNIACNSARSILTLAAFDFNSLRDFFVPDSSASEKLNRSHRLVSIIHLEGLESKGVRRREKEKGRGTNSISESISISIASAACLTQLSS
jgi:hypothetical protein